MEVYVYQSGSAHDITGSSNHSITSCNGVAAAAKEGELQDEGQTQRGQQAAAGLEEIGKYRAQAQQNSADAIRAAEERHAKANQRLTHGARAAVTVLQTPGATVVSYVETKKQPPHGKHKAEGRDKATTGLGAGLEETGKHRGEEWQHEEWGTGSAAHEKTQKSNQAKGAAAHAPVGATAVSHQEAKKSATRHKEIWRKLTGQAEERYGASEYAKQAAVKGNKDVTLCTGRTAAEYAKTAAEKAMDVTLSTGQTASEYAKQAAVKAKDVTLSTGGTTVEYAKTATEKAKDVTLSTGQTASEYAKQAAVKAKDVTLSTGAIVSLKAKEETADTAHKVAEYTREKAEQGKAAAAEAQEKAKETAAHAADSAEEPVSDKADKAKRSDAETADKAKRSDEETENKASEMAAQTKDSAKDTPRGMAHKAGANAAQTKDTVEDAAGAMAQKTRDTLPQAGHKAEEAKNRAAETGKSTAATPGGAGAIAKAKETANAGDDTTIVGDVLEAVSATVSGIVQHTKGIVAGEDELVPVSKEDKGKLEA
ncbi:hypothetical protein GUJ93_ZPchr0002g24889 [Zizania palustris]|uniref:Uncharacterized protein n=1 Tax=Zizania palustris TaxID=103762 RepID=A0A8J5S5I5_ZIZPA|nr:hypothetical protein GUJ93_ZPchr0002g24889 [Zizania palustris]